MSSIRSEQSLRIVSVSTDYPGPRTPRNGLFVQRRLAAVARLEDVHVIHLEPWFPWLRPWNCAPEHNGYANHPPAVHRKMFYLPGVLKGLDSYWVKQAIIPEIRSLERSGRFDLIDAHFGYPEGVGCVKAARRLRRPVFITMRGLERPVLKHSWRGAQLLWALRQCTGIVSVSESLKKLVVSHGIDADKICVTPNAVDRVLFGTGDQKEARRSLEFDEDCRLVVSVGMLVQGKGHHLLLEAFARLRQKYRDLRLAIIGGPAFEPRYPERLKRLAQDRGISDFVFLTGSQSPQRVAQWLRAADVFALATFDEGCCNAVLEALACGVPVVTTPVGDNARLIEPPQRGLLVRVGDINALAEGLNAALAKSWDRDAISSFRTDYNWDKVAEKTASFFRERLQKVGPCAE